jgi:hypothetical protein
MDIDDVPADLPRDGSRGILAGAQPKLCVYLQDGSYVAGQSAEEVSQRSEICEDLAHQLIRARGWTRQLIPSAAPTLPLSARVAVARKDWVSRAELTRLMSRVQALLNW